MALFMALGGLAAFLWALRSGQYDDLEGAAYRVLYDHIDPEAPPTETEDKAEASDNAKPSKQA
jgi:cbb3-type cytochrome oxidase maturation protein